MHFHVLGLGPVGSLVSHHLCKTLDTTKHGVVLIHKNAQQLKRANSVENTLKVERQGVVDTSTTSLSEIFDLAKQLRYEKKQAKHLSRNKPTSHNTTAGAYNPNARDSPLLPIESLIVALKAYTVVDSVKALLPRLTPTSTIVLLHNGMGVYERLVEDVFRNPEQRPHFIVAVNNHQFLTDERDGAGLGDKGLLTDTATAAKVKKLYLIDLNAATDVTQVFALPSPQVVPVTKTPFLDIVSKLTAAGIDAKLIPAKLEGVAFGQDVIIGGETRHTLYVSNDNDFQATVADPLKLPADLTRGLILNPNKFFVFAFSDSELPGYIPQQIRFTRQDD